ncbi:TRM11 family SAM-dependent methyltransferase [Enemella sp. A6]|uniref:TRM11 family SAM-dependent methyltransferase n=1 Tax=Enemella sp. A6 TaxID=3440152 RepID=UPI003EC039B6
MLLNPSANRVYGGQVASLAEAELRVCAPWASEVATTTVAGVDYLGFTTEAEPNPDQARLLADQSAFLALFEMQDENLLRPVEVHPTGKLDDDLVTIPKYQGKTNEQFTRLLLNVTLSQVRGDKPTPWTVLDPMAGRGTTLTSAWLLGHHGAGVEADTKAVEAMGAFLRTWLRRKRLKHRAESNPVRREGKSLGRRFDATVQQPGGPELSLSVFTGDTRQSAALWGKRRFDAIVTDAPYGVVHGSKADHRRDRSPAALLGEAIGVWAGQLRPGGALGLSWNTHGLAREDVLGLLTEAGLTPCGDGGENDPWQRFGHRVDSSIFRDLVVATKN